MEAAKQIVIDK
jgi:GTP1/Obg family GTP-binding protein